MPGFRNRSRAGLIWDEGLIKSAKVPGLRDIFVFGWGGHSLHPKTRVHFSRSKQGGVYALLSLLYQRMGILI